jgi:hypothetical protein
MSKDDRFGEQAAAVLADASAGLSLREVADRIRWETCAGADVPCLACVDVAVFTEFFNRTRDWVDLEAMQAAGTLESSALQWLSQPAWVPTTSASCIAQASPRVD